MRKRSLLVTMSLVALLLALVPSTSVAQGPTTLIWMVLDGSGSIAGGPGKSAADFQIMLNGVAAAVEDPTCVPHDGSVEIAVIQFSTTAALEAGPTVLNSTATATNFANQVRAITQMGNLTNYQDAFDLTRTTMTGSANWATATNRVVNMSTDGVPTAGTPDPVTGAENARDALVAAGITELDVEAIGMAAADITWIQNNILYPQPGNIAPPYTPGWLIEIASFQEYAASVCNKFQQVVPPVPPPPEPEEEFVPEPASIILLGSGLIGVAAYAGRRLRKR